MRDDTAGPAAHRLGGCLDHDADHATVFADVDDVEPLKADQEVATVAVARWFRTWARAGARRRLGHRRGLPG